MRLVRRLIVAVLAACLLAGCGVPADSGPRALDRPQTAYGSGGPAPDEFGPAVERLYLVRGGKLTRVLRRVPAARTPEQMVTDLLAGPTGEEQEDGLTSALSTMTVGRTTIGQRRASVEIDEVAGQGARSDEVLAYGQIVCSLTSQGAEVGTVAFTRGGKPLAVPRGDGSLSTQPLTVADYSSLIAS
jgi:hypothetical protein